MIISQGKELEAQHEVEAFGDLLGQSGSSSMPPPAFEEATAAAVHDPVNFSDEIPEPGEEPPPFEPYEAECFEIGSGNIVSHDPHLNSDGEALYRFLLSQAATAPSYRLHCRGTHSETHRRWVTSTNTEGRSETRRETYTESITDFDFYIDIGPHIVASAVHWSVADSKPAYRGRMIREIESPEGRRRAKRAEKTAFKHWVEERTARGLPPWITDMGGWREGMRDDVNVLRSSRTLREWADDYCASRKYLKEFVYEKVLYGWNLQQLESAVRSSITATLYEGNLQVEFKNHGSKVYVRPDNRLSRTLSNKWLKILSFILLVYPFIWLFKRFHPRGGGRWEVCGGAYALKRWVPVEADAHGNQGPPQNDFVSEGSHAPPRIIQTPSGTSRLVGLREGEWFRKWKGTITRAINNNYQSSTPIFTPTNGGVEEAFLLDGY